MFQRGGGLVRRFHTLPTNHPQSVARHSWGAAMIAQYLDPNCRKEVILELLQHDLAEKVVGDMPSPAKRLLPELRKLYEEAETLVRGEYDFLPRGFSEEEERLMTCADLLDCLAYAKEEMTSGNYRMRKVADGAYQQIMTLGVPAATALAEALLRWDNT